MKRLLALGLLCLSPTLTGCSTQASASSTDSLRAFTFTTEGGDSGGPIRARNLEPSSGELGPESVQSPEGRFFGDLVMHPKLALLFATEGNHNIQSFAVDRQSGTLVPKATTTVPGNLESDDELMVHPEGKFLYLCHNDRVTPFTLLDVDGTLQVGTPAVVHGAGDLNHGVIDRSGQLLYVADRKGGNVLGFRIDESGTLLPISAHPLASVVGGTLRRLVIDDSNRFLFALNDNGDQVLGFAIKSDGALAANGSKSVGAAAERHLDMVARGDLLYVGEQANCVVQSLRIDKNGNLTAEGRFSQGGGLLSLARALPLLVNANSTGVFSLRAQLLDEDGILKPVEGKEVPNACLDLEVAVVTAP